MKKVLVVFILFYGVVPATFGQDISFVYYRFDDSNGLPSSEVYKIYQDKRGFLWFATDAGVSRYDGRNFLTFNKSNGLPDPVIFGFYEDEFERLWFRSFSGDLSFFEQERITVYEYNDLIRQVITNKILSSIVVDSTKTTWFGSSLDGALWNINKSGGVARIEQPDKTLFIKTIDKKEHVIGYTGTPININQICLDTNCFPITLSDTVHHQAVVNYAYWLNDLYIFINKNLFRHDGVSLVPVLTAENPIISLSVDAEQQLWIGYFNGGVERFQNRNLHDGKFFQPLNGLSVTSVIIDFEGGHWISTLDKGVFHFPNLHVNRFPLEFNSKISCVAYTSNKIYTGDYHGTLRIYEEGERKGRILANFEAPLLSVFCDSKSRIWVSSISGTYIVDQFGDLLKSIPEIKSIKDFAEDEWGKVWAVNQNSITQFYQTGNIASQTFRNQWGRALHVSRGRLLISNLTGVTQYDIGDMDLGRNIKLLDAFKVMDIIELNERHYIFGTIGNGLVLLKDSTVTVFDKSTGFPANNIHSLIQDRDIFWLGTEEGIIRVQLDEATKTTPSFQWISQGQGLLKSKNTFLTHRGNNLWSFYESDFSVLPKAEVKYPNAKPRFYKTGVYRNDDEAIEGPLTFNQNNVKVYAQYISYKNRKVRFRYRVRNDMPWSYTTDEVIQFFSLAPGEYTVQVEYSNSPKQWETVVHQQLVITPPWWESGYFATVVVVIIVGVSFILYRLKIQGAKIKEQSYKKYIEGTENERSRISGELHDNIGSRLSFVKRIVTDKNPEQVERASAELDSIIQDIRLLSHDLAPPSGHLTGIRPLAEKLVRDASNSCSTDFQLHFYDFPDHLSNEQVQQLYRILQEAIHNIVLHARAKQADIQFFGYDRELVITIDDDGVGFNTQQLRDGLGLSQMRVRTESLNGKIEISSAPNEGCSVTIVTPK